MALIEKPPLIFSDFDEFSVPGLISKWSFQVENGQRQESSDYLDLIYGAGNVSLQELLKLALGGNKQAAKGLLKIIESSLSGLCELCHKNPELFEPIARNKLYWPAFISNLSDSKTRNKKLLVALNLGKDYGLNTSGKQPDWDSLEIDVVLYLRNVMEHFRKSKYYPDQKGRKEAKPPASSAGKLTTQISKINAKFYLKEQSRIFAKNLTPLNRGNYKQWFCAAWPLFISCYGENFESHDRFLHYWKNEVYMEPDPTNPRKKRLKKSARGDIRDAIKKKIRQAMRSIAPKV